MGGFKPPGGTTGFPVTPRGHWSLSLAQQGRPFAWTQPHGKAPGPGWSPGLLWEPGSGR